VKKFLVLQVLSNRDVGLRCAGKRSPPIQQSAFCPIIPTSIAKHRINIGGAT
jgi:hypothetical protein